MWDLHAAAVTGGEEKIIKEKVLVHDEETGDIVWEVLDDPKFSKMKSTMKITPSADDPADSRMTWKLEYEPIDPATPPPKDVEMIHLEVMKALMNHVDTHPDWP